MHLWPWHKIHFDCFTLIGRILSKKSVFHIIEIIFLRAQCITFIGIYWQNMEQKVHMYIFSYIKSLKINNLYFHLLIMNIYIYMKSGSTCKEGAILRQYIYIYSTSECGSAQLILWQLVYESCVGRQKTRINVRMAFLRWDLLERVIFLRMTLQSPSFCKASQSGISNGAFYFSLAEAYVTTWPGAKYCTWRINRRPFVCSLLSYH